jgi:hypothetical protein
LVVAIVPRFQKGEKKRDCLFERRPYRWLVATHTQSPKRNLFSSSSSYHFWLFSSSSVYLLWPFSFLFLALSVELGIIQPNRLCLTSVCTDCAAVAHETISQTRESLFGLLLLCITTPTYPRLSFYLMPAEWFPVADP